MRARFFFWFVCLVGCGNQEPPSAPPPSASAAPAPPPSAAPVASESAAPAASTAPTPSATAQPPAPAFTKTLKDLVGGAKLVKLTWRENLDSNEAKTVTIRTPQTIRAIVDALGADQVPAGTAPAYMSTFTFRFEDAKENPLATVSLYSSPTLPDSAKMFGRIDSADGKFAGVTVAKYDELQKKLKSLGVTLP